MQLLIATSNPHKLEEIRAIIGNKSIELVSLADLPQVLDEPVEDGDTFEANAILKARYYARATGMLCLADDSGLEVDALGGDPGVRSARYSNADAPRAERDAANRRLLLKNLAGVPIEQRAARFVCAMALFDGREPNDEPAAVVRGTLEGRILTPDEAEDPVHPERGRGHNGFGYDPIVQLSDRSLTVAQLSSDDKNAISHRGDAVRKIWPGVAAILGIDLYVGKSALVGLTHVNHNGEIRYREQVYGVITGGNEFGWLLLEPTNGAKVIAIPPCLELARPGEYRLKDSGEIVVDPCFIGTWTVTPPHQDEKPKTLWRKVCSFLATLPCKSPPPHRR